MSIPLATAAPAPPTPTAPLPGGAEPCAPDDALADRVRRVLGTLPAGSTAARALGRALGRHDAPPVVRVRGGLGSGRHALAESLSDGSGVPVGVDDLDELVGAPDPGRAPDVEVLTLCTAPCGHELRWAERPRRHPLLVVATRLRPGAPVPDWATGLPACAPGDADDPGTAAVVGWVSAELGRLPRLRTRRLAAEFARLAARGEAGDVAEAVLCGHSSGEAA